MKIAMALLVAAGLLTAAPTFAADADAPTYEKGPVWVWSEVQTKDGHFEDYMKFLSTSWKSEQEALKKMGYVIDYKVLAVDSPRENEPNLFLGVEYKNMAAFDVSVADEQEVAKKIVGSISKANAESEARGAIRTLKGEVLTRELILK